MVNRATLTLGFFLILGPSLGLGVEADSAETKALRYLSREVPTWRSDNGCASCHHNGDGARALYEAKRRGFTIADSALKDTTDWLIHPERWDHNGGEGPFSDKKLAVVQFTQALSFGIKAGAIESKNSKALLTALDRLVDEQSPDGSWRAETAAPNEIGSPGTYGLTLTTTTALGSLRHFTLKERQPKHQQAVAKAEHWIKRAPVQRVLDASAVLLALGEFPRLEQDMDAQKQKDQCLKTLRIGESQTTGGWGPYRLSPPEPFDTALALLALNAHQVNPEIQAMKQRGRKFLLQTQNPDGSWQETTRPAGAVSLAQRLSTAGWCTLALLSSK